VDGYLWGVAVPKYYYVYILASGITGTLYIGVTSNLPKRVYEHKYKVAPGFTAEHGVDQLVYYEVYEDAEATILQEKQLKKWNRNWKLKLIVQKNPEWEDLCLKIAA